MADNTAGLGIVDVTQPSSPVELGRLDTPGSAWGVVVRDGLAFVADEDGGLRVVDVSDPTQPTELASLAVPGARALALDGHLLFLSCGGNGLQAVDVTDPAQPVSCGFFHTPDWAEGVAAADGLVCVANAWDGLLVLQFEPEDALPSAAGMEPVSLSLGRCFPNPFNPQTTIPFHLTAPQHVRVRVFDLGGAQLRELLNTDLSAGSHRATFDSGGLASGLYLYEVRGARESSTGKMLLLH